MFDRRVLIASALLFGLAFCNLFVFLSDTAIALSTFEILFCRGNESLLSETGAPEESFDSSTGEYRTTQSADYYCQGAEGRRAVTGQVAIFSGASFVVPFLAGMVVAFFSGTIATQLRMRFQRGIIDSI